MRLRHWWLWLFATLSVSCASTTNAGDAAGVTDAATDVPFRLDGSSLTDAGQLPSDASSERCDGAQDARAACLRCVPGVRYPIEGAWEARLATGAVGFRFEASSWRASGGAGGPLLATGFYAVDDRTLTLNELVLDSSFAVAMCPGAPQGVYRIEHAGVQCLEMTLTVVDDRCDARRTALHNARFVRLEASP